jgi:hypothetical protein
VKAVLLNGSKLNDAEMTRLKSLLINEFRRNGKEIEDIDLENIKISSCLGCFGCWVNTPGICVINDEGRVVAEKVIQSDIIVFFTPVIFGGYSSEFKKAADRLIPLISPFFTKINGEVHHKPRYNKYPILIGIGVLSEEDREKEKLFNKLVERNAINFHSPSFSSRILIKGQPEETIKNKIQEMFKEAGVLNG